MSRRCSLTTSTNFSSVNIKLLDEHEAGGDAHGLRLARLAEGFGVDEAREDFSALDDARAGAAEVARRVHGPHAAGTHGGQFVPAARQSRAFESAQSVLLVVAARREDYDFGRVRLNLFGGGGARLRARVAEGRVAARERDLFGNPMAGRKRRLKPFEYERARSALDFRETDGERVQPPPQVAGEP